MSAVGMVSSEKCDFTFKVVVVGNAGVGKSTLLLRLTKDEFKEGYISTIGVDFKVYKTVVDGKSIKLQLWDTAGQERFANIASSYYRGADGIVYVYDICNENSFESIKDRWLKEVEFHLSKSNNCKLILGNKCDAVDERAIDYERGEDLAKSLEDTSFFETSAREGSHVVDAFTTLAANILKKKSAPQSKELSQLSSQIAGLMDLSKACSLQLELYNYQRQLSEFTYQHNTNGIRATEEKIATTKQELQKTGLQDKVSRRDEASLQAELQKIKGDLTRLKDQYAQKKSGSSTSATTQSQSQPQPQTSTTAVSLDSSGTTNAQQNQDQGCCILL